MSWSKAAPKTPGWYFVVLNFPGNVSPVRALFDGRRPDDYLIYDLDKPGMFWRPGLDTTVWFSEKIEPPAWPKLSPSDSPSPPG